MTRLRIWICSVFALVLAAAVAVVLPSLAADKNTDLARELIDRFYDAVAPGSTALEGFLSDSFQIIGTDGLHFDRSEYLKFPKFHFTPTSASWLNAVEGFFAKLTKRRLKRGVFRSVVDLQEAINRFIAETNANPKPFVWTAAPTRVLAAVTRGKQALESIH